ncbi:MAG: hypothetical protein L3J61_05405, partial [Ghiorsea sp.]|nr:hypothetical protein [Ghiorsea sp.]
SLYSLLPQFEEKVKLIYIDPPYNTGNDSFQYNDSFNHSTWLTFMKNRLEVARRLLRKDGVIFVQCDDNEQAYLKLLLDDIFKRENFIETITVVNNPRGRDYGGVANVMPVFAVVMLVFSMANVALPGSSAFIGEIMVLIGTFAADPAALMISAKWIAIAAAISVVLSACYTLWMYKRVIMGDLVKDSVRSMPDMSVREFGIFVPLIILTVWVGFYPAPVLDILHESVAHLIEQATTSKLDAAALIDHSTALHAVTH